MHTNIWQTQGVASWQNGTRRRDGIKVMWCHSHLHVVWLVFDGSIPTCTCFRSENFNSTIHVVALEQCVGLMVVWGMQVSLFLVLCSPMPDTLGPKCVLISVLITKFSHLSENITMLVATQLLYLCPVVSMLVGQQMELRCSHYNRRAIHKCIWWLRDVRG